MPPKTKPTARGGGKRVAGGMALMPPAVSKQVKTIGDMINRGRHKIAGQMMNIWEDRQTGGAYTKSKKFQHGGACETKQVGGNIFRRVGQFVRDSGRKVGRFVRDKAIPFAERTKIISRASDATGALLSAMPDPRAKALGAAFGVAGQVAKKAGFGVQQGGAVPLRPTHAPSWGHHALTGY